MRIDKWLWATRIYKTRALAAAACRNGQVTIAGQPVKPSREIKIDDLVLADNSTVKRTLKVQGLPAQRVGAAVVAEFLEDLTPASEYQKPRESALQPLFFRPKGAGRPTKKDRRTMAKIKKLF